MEPRSVYAQPRWAPALRSTRAIRPRMSNTRTGGAPPLSPILEPILHPLYAATSVRTDAAAVDERMRPRSAAVRAGGRLDSRGGRAQPLVHERLCSVRANAPSAVSRDLHRLRRPFRGALETRIPGARGKRSLGLATRIVRARARHHLTHSVSHVGCVHSSRSRLA